MKFKGIGANPPFNVSNVKTGNGTGGDVTIGKRFYDKGVSLLENDGEYGFIMLKGITDNILKEQRLEFSKLNYMSDDNYWEYNTCWFHAKKQPRTSAIKLSDTIISKMILITGNPLWYELNGKINDKMINSSRVDAVYAIIKLPTSSNPVIKSRVNPNYSKLLYGPKLTATLFDNRLTYMTTDMPLCAEFCGAYTTNSVDEAKKLKLFVENNKVFKKLHKVMKTKGLFWTLRHIKPFDINQIVTGEEIPLEWNLSQHEIDKFLSDDYPKKIDQNKYEGTHPDRYINHLRYRSYMSGVERTKARIKSTGEVFTKTDLVLNILAEFSDSLFENTEKTKDYKFLDYACGDGQYLSEFVLRLMKDMKHSYNEALMKVYGVDIEETNCVETIKRLYGAEDEVTIETLSGNNIPPKWQHYHNGSPVVTAVFKVNGKICNIVCADGLKYDYAFGKSAEPEEFGNGLFTEE